MIRYTDGVKQFGAGMSASPELFINIHVIQYSGSGSSSRLEPTPSTAHS